MKFSYFLFDLGGVIVDWDGIAPLLQLTNNRLSAEDARRFWLESPWVRSFEAGKCNEEDFARGVIAELNLQLTPRDFLERFETWDRGTLPGAHELLKALSPKFPLACLSNNNPIHWAVHRRAGVLDYFQHLFASFETGLVKPDREAFEHVIRKLQVPPASILFFDDNPECTEAAARVGITARLAKGVAPVWRSLSEFQIAV